MVLMEPPTHILQIRILHIKKQSYYKCAEWLGNPLGNNNLPEGWMDVFTFLPD